MQLTAITPALSLQGREEKKQADTTQKESPVQFGSSKKTPFAIAALMASIFYAPNAFAYVSDQHLTETNSAPPIERSNTFVNASFVLMFLSLMVVISRTMGSRSDDKKALDNEAFFQALEKNPELQEAIKTLFSEISPMMLPNIPPPDPNSAEQSLEETAILKNILKTANQINKLLSEDQSAQLVFAFIEVDKANLSPKEAFKVYQDALGPNFNWKPVETIVKNFLIKNNPPQGGSGVPKQ